MFRYLSNKKIKKCRMETESISRAQSTRLAPVLKTADEDFLQQMLSAESHSSTPTTFSLDLTETGIDTSADVDANVGALPQNKDKGKVLADYPCESKKLGWFTFRAGKKRNKKETMVCDDQHSLTPIEVEKEEVELSQVLQKLDISSKNNRAFFLSPLSTELVQKFTVVLKDLINGVPTAYNDLVHLLDDSHSTLDSMYKKLPDFIKKLVMQLPEKFKGHLGPDLLAAAAEVPSLAKGSGMNISDFVAKPGAIFSLLRAIMNVLKLRWPAFIGTNVLLSLALFVLLFIFWYCHKRGREERLEREAKVDGADRIEELEEDAMIKES